jgi:hypothetical protein
LAVASDILAGIAIRRLRIRTLPLGKSGGFSLVEVFAYNLVDVFLVVHEALSDFAKSHYSRLVVCFDEGIIASAQLTGAGSGQHNECKAVRDLVKTVFNGYTCHRKRAVSATAGQLSRAPVDRLTRCVTLHEAGELSWLLAYDKPPEYPGTLIPGQYFNE